MKFVFQLTELQRRKCFDILLGIQYVRHWLKSQNSTLTFETYSQFLINIASLYNDFDFNSFQKFNVSQFACENTLGIKFYITVKWFMVNLG